MWEVFCKTVPEDGAQFETGNHLHRKPQKHCFSGFRVFIFYKLGSVVAEMAVDRSRVDKEPERQGWTPCVSVQTYVTWLRLLLWGFCPHFFPHISDGEQNLLDAGSVSCILKNIFPNHSCIYGGVINLADRCLLQVQNSQIIGSVQGCDGPRCAAQKKKETSRGVVN